MSPAVSLHLVCGFPSLPCLISGSCHFMAISISCFCFKTSRSEHFRNGGFTGPRPAKWANAKSRARSENGIWADFKNWRLCTDRAANNVHGNVMKRVWLVVWNMNFIFPYIGNNNPIWLIFFRGIETTNQDETYVCVPGTFASCNPTLLWSENELGDGRWKPCGQENDDQPLDATGFRGAPLSDPSWDHRSQVVPDDVRVRPVIRSSTSVFGGPRFLNLGLPTCAEHKR